MQPLGSATSSNVTISLGMFNINVSVHTAVAEDKSSSMHHACLHLDTSHEDEPMSRVNQLLKCPVCNSTDRAQFVKAKDSAGTLVFIPQETQDAVAAEAAATKGHVNLSVHPAGEVSGVLLPSGKSYYLSIKQPSQAKAYRILAAAIAQRPDLAFMGKFTLRTATSIFQLTVAGEGTLVMRQMAEASLVREHPVIAEAEVRDVELAMAVDLAAALSEPFVHGTHGTGKSQIIAHYVEANTPTDMQAATSTAGGSVVDLFAVLQASLAEASSSKTATAKPAARKAAAKRPAAKRPTAKAS